jgi:hypothetical protein
MSGMTFSFSDADNLAGYRVVRKLGEGARAEVFLGLSHTGAPAERSVALKVFRTTVSERDILHELEVLDRTPKHHCVHLLDVSSGPTGAPVAVLPRVARGSLGSLLHRRGGVDPGEAVTILAPVVRSVGVLHSRGIAHTAVSASTVHFGDDGSPHLLGFGHATLFAAGASEAALDAQSGVRRDRRALAQLTRLVLAGGGPSARSLLQWLEVSEQNLTLASLRELEDRLFTLATPLPVDFGRDGAPGQRKAGAVRPVAPQRMVTGPAFTPPGGSDENREPHGRQVVDRLLGSSPLTPARELVVRALRSVRAGWWVTIALVAAALVAAIVFLPANDPSSATMLPTETEPPTTDSAGPTDPAGIAAMADPAVALPALLAGRAACLEAGSIVCLDSVDQAASGLLAEDSARITADQSGQGDVADSTVGPVTVTEMLGSFALVEFASNDEPASALLVRTETGWRLRMLSGAVSPNDG